MSFLFSSPLTAAIQSDKLNYVGHIISAQKDLQTALVSISHTKTKIRLRGTLWLSTFHLNMGRYYLKNATRPRSYQAKQATVQFKWALQSLRHFHRRLHKAINKGFISSVQGSTLLTESSHIISQLEKLLAGTWANTPPIAHAGPDQQLEAGTTATLDGSASSDVEGHLLSFLWSLTRVPSHSTALLDDPTAVMPTFNADLPGIYQAQLTVNDGLHDSIPDSVQINVATVNTRPVAQAGNDINAYPDESLLLDGSASTDADGDSLSYVWQLLEKPPGSLAKLIISDAVQTQLTVDLAGEYLVQLIVFDGTDYSHADTQTIYVATANVPPIAHAGPDQSAYVSDRVILDGSLSSDADFDPLTYRWSLLSRPTDSQTTLTDAQTAHPEFMLDTPGIYIVQLIVNDGKINSAPDEIIISSLNSRPVADAGPDQTIIAGSQLTLDGSLSHDADQDLLSYAWSVTLQPAQSQINLSDAQLMQAQLVLDNIGFYVFQLIVNDGLLSSTPDTVNIRVEPTEALFIQLDSPTAALYTQQTQVFFSGQLNQHATLSLNGENIPLANDLSFNHKVMLNEGNNAFILTATNALGDQLSISRTVIRDTVKPIITAALIQIAPPNAESQVIITGQAGSLEPDSQLTLINLSSGQTLTLTAAIDGSFVGQLNGTDGDRYELMISDAAGNMSESVKLDDGSIILPPDPTTIAPSLDPTQDISLKAATAFLYSGPTPIQTGLNPDTIDSKRVLILRGKVLDKNNQPLPGVTIRIKAHSEYGQTLSRSNGQFDMVVNGGGLITLDYQKKGYLPLQRQVQAPWQDFANVETVVLIKLDPQMTVVDLSAGSTSLQIAQGSINQDSDGQRQATLLFKQGTTATMTLADGSQQALNKITVRATEYTVGANGPQRMPGSLPPASGYTYAVELSTDEAIAASATQVTFNQAVPVYVDNFLDFPIGEVVPVGYYDRDKSAWIASANGRVIKILSINNTLAELDTDGDTLADTKMQLAELGISDAERRQLATFLECGEIILLVSVEAPLSVLLETGSNA